ncbi:hypothetical protein D5086_014969 [Populus alba]|uniref:Uncharacterized protein n=1 Tax=Populus alba TaxID=43335 RepID=A0ACC4C1V5_POPAL
MTFRKEKGNISPEGDFSFRPEIETTHRTSLAVRIGPKYEREGSLPGIDRSEFNGSALSMPSHVSMPSRNGDSSFEENQPLEKRQRVRSSIQIKIYEIYTIQVQAEDVLEDIPITNLPANKVCQKVVERSSSQAPPPSVILCGYCGYGSDSEAISWRKKAKLAQNIIPFVPTDVVKPGRSQLKVVVHIDYDRDKPHRLLIELNELKHLGVLGFLKLAVGIGFYWCWSYWWWIQTM